MMTLRMVLSSSDSTEIYSDNKPHDFRVHLSRPMRLTGNWSVSLLEFSMPVVQSKLPTHELFIFASICGDTILSGKELPLLRRVYLTKDDNIIYQFPFEVPLRVGQFQDIHIYIKDANGHPASFLNQKVTVTLQLKKHIFIT